MIDVSDGLAVDMHHITNESKCGAEIRAERIPVSEAAKRLGDDPLQHSLTDGEDYELLFTLSEEDVSKAQSCLYSLGVKASHIGRIIKEGVVLIDENGDKRELPATGFEHFTKKAQSR
jgi:thiamine-monophosphate kinase